MSWQRINITAVRAWYGKFTLAKRSDRLQHPRFLSSTESWQIVVAEYQADLDIINDEGKVFWNPYGTQQSTLLKELSLSH